VLEGEWAKRIGRMQSLLGIRQGQLRPLPADPGFLKRLSGLVVPPDPTTGVRLGRRYLHPRAGYQLRVPDGWRARLKPHRLVATSPDGAGILLAYRAPQRTRRAAVLALLGGRRRSAARPGSPARARPVARSGSEGPSGHPASGRDAVRMQVLRAGGLQALGGTFEVGTGLRLWVAAVRVRQREGDQRVHVVALYGSRSRWPRQAALPSQVIASLRPLGPSLPREARPYQIRVLRSPAARPLRSWTGCAAGPAARELVRRLNGLAPGTVLSGGRWLKCVTRTSSASSRFEPRALRRR
jgi:hypothetical protein